MNATEEATTTATPRLTLDVRVRRGHYTITDPGRESIHFHFIAGGRQDGGPAQVGFSLPIDSYNPDPKLIPEYLEGDVGNEVPLEILRRAIPMLDELYIYNGSLKDAQELLAFLEPHAAALELHWCEDRRDRLRERIAKLQEELATAEKAVGYARNEWEAERENARPEEGE